MRALGARAGSANAPSVQEKQRLYGSVARRCTHSRQARAPQLAFVHTTSASQSSAQTQHSPRSSATVKLEKERKFVNIF